MKSETSKCLTFLVKQWLKHLIVKVVSDSFCFDHLIVAVECLIEEQLRQRIWSSTQEVSKSQKVLRFDTQPGILHSVYWIFLNCRGHLIRCRSIFIQWSFSLAESRSLQSGCGNPICHCISKMSSFLEKIKCNIKKVEKVITATQSCTVPSPTFCLEHYKNKCLKDFPAHICQHLSGRYCVCISQCVWTGNQRESVWGPDASRQSVIAEFLCVFVCNKYIVNGILAPTESKKSHISLSRKLNLGQCQHANMFTVTMLAVIDQAIN